MSLSHTIGHDIGVAVERGDEERREDEHDQADELRECYRAEDAEDGALLRPVVLSCTEVLPYACGQGKGEARHRKEGEALYLAVCTRACDGG